MPGLQNNIVYGEGFRLQASSARAIADMVHIATDVGHINYTGNPEGVIAANPASLCHDPVAGLVYIKVTGSGVFGWAPIGTGSGTVSSVSGTLNRITSTGGSTPVIDISAAYIGQTSLTTLGTITTGVWNGTKIDETHGGTNQSTYTTGDILYASASNTLSKLGISTDGKVLTLASGIPSWQNPLVMTLTGDSGGALSPTSGNFNILGNTTAAGTSPLKVQGLGSTLTIVAQRSQALASADNTKVGLSNFDSSFFSVDVNGFVTASATGILKTLTGNSGGAISPSSNNINIQTANATVTFAGSGSTLTEDFATSNLVLGSSLPSATGAALENVGLGYQVLNSVTSASENTMIGYQTGFLIQTCTENTGIGYHSLTNLATGSGSNTALGTNTLPNITTGSRNTAIGKSAGNLYTSSESNNILIMHPGVAGESNVIRIGVQGTGPAQQNQCYLAGVLNTVSGRVVNITSPGAYPYTTLITDDVILVDTSSARTINLISSPVTGTTYRIKDSVGSAALNNITIVPAAGNIDGSANFVMSANYQSVDLVYSGTQWNKF